MVRSHRARRFCRRPCKNLEHVRQTGRTACRVSPRGSTVQQSASKSTREEKVYLCHRVSAAYVALTNIAKRIKKTNIGPWAGFAFSTMGISTLPATARRTASFTGIGFRVRATLPTLPRNEKRCARHSGQLNCLANHANRHSGQYSFLQQSKRMMCILSTPSKHILQTIKRFY